MKSTGKIIMTGRLRRFSVIAIHAALLGTLTGCTETPLFDVGGNESDTPSTTDASAAQSGNGISADGFVQVQAETAALGAPDLATAKPAIIINPLALVETTATESDESDDNTEGTATEVDSDSAESGSSTDQEPLPVIAENNDIDRGAETIDNDTTVSESSDTDTSDSTQVADRKTDNLTTSDSSDGFVEAENSIELYPGDSVESKDATATFFTSHTTPGFTGEVIDDSIHVTWNADPDALGYNVYRQAEYVTTVWENSYVESDLFDQDYYYEIQAFDQTKTIYYYVATGLTVTVHSAGRTNPALAKANPDRLQDYELIFSDEFNGDFLDTSKWNTSLLWGDEIIINGEVQYYVDINNKPDFGFNPFSFDGENLIINSIETPSELSEKALGQPYLSGVITSYDALQFTYGYAETRAKVTFGRGYWPAFWLLNAYYGQGGDDPEIDIMEFIGHDQDVVYHTYHYYDANGKLRSTESEPTPGIDYTADFHTFGVEWKPGTIIYFVDGIEVHRVTDPKVSQQSMYVIANTALGGWWAGDPDETTPFPGKFMIDYIRVYQRTTPFDDVLLNDGMTNVPFADDIPGQAIPNHRPTPEQWPAGYPHRQ